MKKYFSFSPSPVHIVYQRAAERAADFIEKYLESTMLFHDKRDLWNFCLKEVEDKGLFIECGVFNADSINYFATKKSKLSFMVLIVLKD